MATITPIFMEECERIIVCLRADTSFFIAMSPLGFDYQIIWERFSRRRRRAATRAANVRIGRAQRSQGSDQ